MASFMNSETPNIFSLALKGHNDVKESHPLFKETNLSRRETATNFTSNSCLYLSEVDNQSDGKSEDLSIGEQVENPLLDSETEIFWDKIRSKLIKKKQRKYKSEAVRAKKVSQLFKRNRKLKNKVNFNMVLFDKTMAILNGLVNKAKNQGDVVDKITSQEAERLHSEIIDGLTTYHSNKKETFEEEDMLTHAEIVNDRPIIEEESNSKISKIQQIRKKRRKVEMIKTVKTKKNNKKESGVIVNSINNSSFLNLENIDCRSLEQDSRPQLKVLELNESLEDKFVTTDRLRSQSHELTSGMDRFMLNDATILERDLTPSNFFYRDETVQMKDDGLRLQEANFDGLVWENMSDSFGLRQEYKRSKLDLNYDFDYEYMDL